MLEPFELLCLNCARSKRLRGKDIVVMTDARQVAASAIVQEALRVGLQLFDEDGYPERGAGSSRRKK